MSRRITLEEVIKHHKEKNPNTDYDYSESVLVGKYKFLEYFSKKFG